MPNFDIFPFNVRHNRDSLTAEEVKLLITTTDPKGIGKSNRRWRGLKERPKSRLDRRRPDRPAYRLPAPPEETTR